MADVHDINAAIRTGGERYWRAIYEEYFGRLARFIAKEYGPMADDIAEELSYKTLLKLVNARTRPQFGHYRQFVSWLYKAARCSALDYWRSHAARDDRITDRYECPDDLAMTVPPEDALDVPPDSCVAQVLEQLSERDRLLLAMRANGTPYRDIAAELELKENVARTYFDRAKRKFRTLYLQLKEAPYP